MKNLLYRSIDNMKLSKDNATNPLSSSDIAKLVTTYKSLGVTHVGLSTPMDFPNYYKVWADGIHALGLSILHRPTWNAIEGLYGVTQAVGNNRPANASDYWRNQTKTFIINNPGVFSDGDLWGPLPERTEGIFNDATSFLPNDGPGVQTNYTTFFNGLIDDSLAAFSSIGKKVNVGFTTNNYSEIASGWIQQGLFDKAGRVVADHYGLTHTTLEMDQNLRGINSQHNHVVFLQEWANYWDTDPSVNLTNTKAMFDAFDKLTTDGIINGFNYWGGWPGAVESILNPDFTLNDKGKLLQSYFGGAASPTPTPTPNPTPTPVPTGTSISSTGVVVHGNLFLHTVTVNGKVIGSVEILH